VIALEFLEAVFKLGLPVLLLSWALINRLYRTGKITEGADPKAVKFTLKQLKKGWDKEDRSKSDFAQNKWMRFGGGFYGVTALATFIIMEVTDALSFLWDFPGFTELFKGGLVSFVIGLVTNQFETFISSLIWFAYWSGDDHTLIVWVIIPYLGYLAGLNLASRSLPEPILKPLNRLKRFFPFS
jgi:hypothetical protein